MLKNFTIFALICCSLIFASMFTSKSIHFDDVKSVHDSNTISNELLVISTENGLDASSIETISGFTTSNSENIEWFINDTLENKVILSSSQSESSNQIILSINLTSLDKWDWSLTINFTQYDDCSCLFEITQYYDSNYYTQSKIGIFIGENVTNHGPILLLEEIGWVTGDSFNISGMIIDDNLDVNTSLDFSICKSGYCEGINIPISEQILEDVIFNQITNKIRTFAVAIELEQINHSQESSIIEDGEWKIIGRAVNQIVAGGYDQVDFWLNNIEPTASISAYDFVIESTSTILIDASHSDDYYWGRSSLKYDWKINENGVIRAPINSEILGESILGIPADKNCSITITLTVRDATGLSNTTSHQVTIANSKPIAVMSLDGKYVNHNDIITLGENESWPLLSLSTDTPNDIETLQHSWYYEGILIEEGESSVLSNDFLYKDTEQKLTLKITDNDGLEDSITIWVISQEASQLKSENKSNSNLPYIIALLISIIIIISITYYRKIKTKRIALPKWKK